MNKNKLRFPWCASILITRPTVDCSHLHEQTPVQERLAIKIASILLGSVIWWVMLESFFH